MLKERSSVHLKMSKKIIVQERMTALYLKEVEQKQLWVLKSGHKAIIIN